MTTTMLILAHPDDEAISCAGLIQRRREEGGDVKLLTMFGRKYNYGEGPQYRWEQKQQLQDVCLYLGIAQQRYFELEEGEPQKHGYYPLLLKIETALRDWQPQEVVIPCEHDLNQDHRFLAECCKIALRPGNLNKVERVLAAQEMGSTRGQWYELMSDEQLTRKITAVGMYMQEVRSGDHPRAPKKITAYHEYLGAKVGAAQAELYDLILQR